MIELAALPLVVLWALVMWEPAAKARRRRLALKEVRRRSLRRLH